MVYNRIPVTFGQLSVITGPTVSFQYDVVQMLVISGIDLPDYYTVDFCNVGDDHTVTVTGTPDGVRIPDDLLLDGRDIEAYIILTGIDEGAVETRYKVTLPVRNRPMRSGVTPTPEERLEIETLVNALNDGVERAEDAATDAEGQADRAETAAENAESAVEHYPKIEDGYWYVWLNGGWVNTGVKAEGVDGKGIASVTGQKTSTSGLVDTYTLTVTYTDSTTDTITFTVTNGRDGVDGYSPTATVTKSGDTATITITDKNGTTTATITDGFSPAVTITPITGGHEVKITDKDHPSGQTFDVLNGEVTQAALDAALATKAPVIIDTASGAIASFSDGADAMPIKSLVVSIEPVQDLHGQDAPYPAGGGANKWDEVWEVGGIGSDGQNQAGSTTIRSKNYIPVSADTSYYYYNGANVTAGLRFYDATQTHIGNAAGTANMAFTTPSGTAYMRFVVFADYGTTYNNNIAINYPATVTTYSPFENECPISGWTGMNLTRDGANVWDEETLDGYYDSNGDFVSSANHICSKNFTLCKPSTSYYVYAPANFYFVFYDAQKNHISSSQKPKNAVFTTPANACYFHIWHSKSSYGSQTYQHDISINYPSTDTAYHSGTANETIPISWQTEAGTVYGGSDEIVSGALVSKYGMVDLGTLDFQTYSDPARHIFRANYPQPEPKLPSSNYLPVNAICSQYYVMAYSPISANDNGAFAMGNGKLIIIDHAYSDASAFETAMSGVQLCYELATPVEYQLDPITLNTLYGQNNIFADCGDVTCEYPCDTKKYIDKKLAALVAALS